MGNLKIVFWLASGTVACWFFHPLAAWFYLALGLIMVFFVLRKLLCTNCYYYDRWCCLGWGKIAGFFFRKGKLENFNTSPGQKIAPLTYGLLSLVPLVLIAISLIQQITIPKIIALILFLAISFYSASFGRKKACQRCKMRLICKGSVAKD